MENLKQDMKCEAIVEKAKTIVQENYTDSRLSIKIIGEKILFLTPDYIGRLFKKTTGIGLKQYISICRIDKAKELLENKEYRISDVARMCGFADNTKYFSCVFKKLVGVPPSEYKKM